VHGQVAAATRSPPRLLQIIYLRNFTFMIYLVTAGSFRICTW